MSVTLLDQPIATPSQPVDKIVFTAGNTFTLKAPAKAVFNIITDFPSYFKWNTWTPEISWDSSPLRPGVKGLMKTDTKYDIPLEILKVEQSESKHMIAWQSQKLPWWLVGIERVHVVTPLDNDARACKVEQWVSMSGLFAYVFKHFGVLQQIKKDNVRYAREMKAFAEAQL